VREAVAPESNTIVVENGGKHEGRSACLSFDKPRRIQCGMIHICYPVISPGKSLTITPRRSRFINDGGRNAFLHAATVRANYSAELRVLSAGYADAFCPLHPMNRQAPLSMRASKGSPIAQ